MIFDTIRLVGASNVDLPIRNIEQATASYILKAADGLGPPDIDVLIKQSLYQGGVYQNSRPQGREPVIRILLNPIGAQTTESLRTILYGMISTTKYKPGKIQIRSAGVTVAETTCWVKRFEVGLFNPDVEVQITYDCLGPYLSAPADVSPATGAISKSAPVIPYSGTAPSGFKMEISLLGAPSSITLTDTDTGEKMLITYAFAAGDVVLFDTRAGSRTVSVTRSGTTTSLLQYLSADSSWPQLEAGNNSFTMSTSNWNWVSLSYRPQYWGV